MSNITTKLVTDTRLKQLLDCYGSESSSWPEDERQAAISLLKGSPELKHYREELRELDKHLSQFQVEENLAVDQPAIQSLEKRILSQLPEQTSTRDSSDIIQNSSNNVAPVKHIHRSRFWIGSIAASLFIVGLSAGVIHQLLSPGQNSINPQISKAQNDTEFARWAWEEVTGEPLMIDSESDPATLLALVELELPLEEQ